MRKELWVGHLLKKWITVGILFAGATTKTNSKQLNIQTIMKKTINKISLKTDKIVRLSAKQANQVLGGTPSATTVKTTLSSKIICL